MALGTFEIENGIESEDLEYSRISLRTRYNDMQALILAGGAGTRLSSVLGELNKPMAPVAGRPFLEYLLLRLKKYEIDEVTLCVGYKADLIQSYFGTGKRWGMHVSYSHESDFLGTGGALKLAEAYIHEKECFVMNGDSLFAIDLSTLMHYHRMMKAKATLALAQVENTQRYGSVGLNKAGEVVSFIEKRESNNEGLINGGVYVFAREVLDLIPDGQPVSLEKDILPGLIGHAVYGLPSQDYFIDIGLPEDYKMLCATPGQLLATVD
jgi:D-glycero-alpha-D-manno-heptose 1-phosphate guanylyltransferase